MSMTISPLTEQVARQALLAKKAGRELALLSPDKKKSILEAMATALENNVADILSIASGVIVGTHFKVDGDTWSPVDAERVKRFMAIVESLR